MSYGIIRIAKYKKGSVKGIEIHDQREKDVSHTNKDIDFDKSHLNYDLHNQEQISFTQQVNSRIKELNLNKAVRKDAIVMCQCLITSRHEFFENMDYNERKEFFQHAYDFVAEKYGTENIVSATVHYDERTPHLHVNFVPVTSDGRLCAKDLFKKQDLVMLHDEFYKHNKSKGYNLERGEGKEEYQKHLITEEFKVKKMKEEIHVEQLKIEKVKSRLEKDTVDLEKDENTLLELRKRLTADLKSARDRVSRLNNLHMFEPKKVFFSDEVEVKIT